MASAKTIKKDRFDIVLKGRGITLQMIAEETGYMRPAVSRALNNEKMSEPMLDKISRYLGVSPDFFTGKAALRKVKEDKIEQVVSWLQVTPGFEILIDGYYVPTYSRYLFTRNWNKPITETVPEYGHIQNAYIGLGESGVFIKDSGVQHFDASFISDNFNYLVVETYEFMKDQARSVLENDQSFRDYQLEEEQVEEQYLRDADYYDSLFEVIEPGEDPDV